MTVSTERLVHDKLSLSPSLTSISASKAFFQSEKTRYFKGQVS